MIQCKCGKLYIDKNINISVNDQTYSLLHNKNIFLESQQVFSSISEKLNNVNVEKLTIDTPINLENQIKIVLKTQSGKLITTKYLGIFGKRLNLDSINIPICDLLITHIDERLVLQIYSICDFSTGDCCDKLPDFTISSIINNFCIPPPCDLFIEEIITSSTTSTITSSSTSSTTTSSTSSTTTTSTTCDPLPSPCNYEGQFGSPENVYVNSCIYIIDEETYPVISGYNPACSPSINEQEQYPNIFDSNEANIYGIYASYLNCYDSSKVQLSYGFVPCENNNGCVWQSVLPPPEDTNGDGELDFQGPPYWQLISNICGSLGVEVSCNSFTFASNCGDCTGWDLYSPPNENGVIILTSCANFMP